MHDSSPTRFDPALLFAALLAGVLFCGTHLLNGWLFEWASISGHVCFVYLPSFLRLANVLVLGMLWGTAGTALGGVLLIFWSQDSWLMSILNLCVSASAAALAVLCLQSGLRRALSPTRLPDLLMLALLCGVINASLHHLVWSELDPSQLINPLQLPYMMVGDVNGALLGALALGWVARHTRIADFLRQRINDAS